MHLYLAKILVEQKLDYTLTFCNLDPSQMVCTSELHKPLRNLCHEGVKQPSTLERLCHVDVLRCQRRGLERVLYI